MYSTYKPYIEDFLILLWHIVLSLPTAILTFFCFYLLSERQNYYSGLPNFHVRVRDIGCIFISKVSFFFKQRTLLTGDV
jgi:hypothetical protein